ncbi:MAG TPA: methyltransferase domain-containing protein [Thermoleophilaceae bacterium]|nr:methyltransferase domain-containing protein [Thermoleophilaceae bacterium]
MATAAPDEIRDVNIRYHDLAASDYDAKWGIDYGEAGQAQVIGKLAKALGQEPGRYQRSIEIGAGTGYFTLNLLRAGVIGEAVATDISPGMLETLGRSADRLGLEVKTIRCEADRLPFADESFDLVFGHAVLHHLPDLDAAFAEFRRVLRPGGTLVFCGEPSRYGDMLSQVPKRTAVAVAPAWRRLMRATKRDFFAEPKGREEANLEWLVDVHAFTPRQLSRLARAGGFEDVRVTGEELTATWFGWMNRTLESTAEPEGVPWLWRQYAYRGYLTLQALDRAVLEERLPAAIFYNLLISARKCV